MFTASPYIREVDPTEFKKRMRIAREWAGLNAQPDLVRVLKENGEKRMGSSTVQKIESGRDTPSPSQVRAIARACQVPEEFLLDEDYDPFSEQLSASDLFARLDSIDAQIDDGLTMLRGLASESILSKIEQIVREADERAARSEQDRTQGSGQS